MCLKVSISQLCYASLHEDLLDHKVAQLREAQDFLEDLDMTVGAPQPRQGELHLAQRLGHPDEVALGIFVAVIDFARL